MPTPYCTFWDLFKDYLEMAIQQGGDVETVTKWVNAYQGGYPSIRQSEFVEWLAGEIFLCEKCGHEFKSKDEEIESDQVLCAPCAGRERGHAAPRGRRR